MIKKKFGTRLIFCLTLLVGVNTISPVSAAGGDLGVGTTTLGTIIVDGKGMSAYYYLPDVPNSGVSSCTGGCLIHWPAITSTSVTPLVQGVTAKVSVIPTSNQILINGRPIYTFAGDQKVGDVNGQGIGGVWYVISPAGIEFNAAEIAKESAKPSASPSPTPTITHRSTPKPKVQVTKKPKPKKSKVNSYYGR